ncbi:MAG: rhodanese-related sulfurtransferase [Saprospiraceae bacterium]|nr:rhodanese-related sulfurtransferase [Saprospiraceae bacterium]MDW8228934.1 rhodanese-related sulfurtransferase [Saprospiraceae bacterium]
MTTFLYNRINRRELRKRLECSAETRTTISFYRYTHIPNPVFFRDHLYGLFSEIGVLGRIYVAQEGINAQISVPTRRMADFKAALDSISFLQNLRLNIAIEDNGKSFFALTIKVRPKIVADGIDDPTFDPSNCGIHLDAEAFNALTDDPETILVDMRNHYESEVGHFQGAILPPVDTFREELPYVAELLADKKDRNIVMYCTGGIRCEKASAYLKHCGFKNVFQLEGGIIEYARQVRARNLPNKFVGKNFVFDERLGERISSEVIAHCHQCGAPCDTHTNCANNYCHLLFIQCAACREKYQGCCSNVCREFSQLPASEQQRQAHYHSFYGKRFPNAHFRSTAEMPLLSDISLEKA